MPSPSRPRVPTLVLALALAAAMAPAGLAQLAHAPASTGEPSSWQPAASPTAGPAHDVDGNEQALLVSTVREGTLRITDEGHTWDPVDPAGVTALDVLADPTDPSRIYLAGNGGVARSTDAGASFEPALAGHLTRVAAVSGNGTVAAHLQPTNGADDQLRISEDGGDTWAKLATPYEGDAALKGLAFGPTDDHLVLADLSTTWITDDGGESWTEQATGARLMATDEDGTIWRYGFAGLERSTDGGQTWTPIPLEASASAIGPHPEDGLYAATDDGVLLTRDGGQTWTDMGADELAWQATGIVADPADSDAVFFSDETIGVNHLAPDGDAGFSYEGRATGFTPTPVWTLDASPQGDVLLAGGPQGLWARTEATAWSHTGAGIGMTGVDAAAAGPGADTVYAGGSDWTGLAYVQVGSLDSSTWPTTTLDGNNDAKVVDLETHPADGETAWAAVRVELAPSKVYQTRDGGQTWDPILELGANPRLVTVGEAVHAISYDEATDELLAATDVGVLAHQGHGVWTPRAVSGQEATTLAAQAGHVYTDGPGRSLWKSPQPGAPLTPWADTPASPSEIQPAPHGSLAWILDAEGAVHACTPASGPPPAGTCEATSPPVAASAIVHAPATGMLWAGSLTDGLHRAATR